MTMGEIGHVLIYSYNTPVAVYLDSDRTIYAPDFHSVTTSRHINIVAEDWGVEVVQLWKWPYV